MELHLLGIRHHGPGSARHVLDRLTEIKPDLILVEGPPEMTQAIQDLDLEKVRPPVALLTYSSKDSQKALFYPFATFSPEWQAFLFARRNDIELRCSDLPIKHYLNLEKPKEENNRQVGIADFAKLESVDEDFWWENTFENRGTGSHEHFEAVFEVMETIRETNGTDFYTTELREAFMRQSIQTAHKEGFERVVFVGGAYHMPALKGYDGYAKADRQIMKGLPKTKVEYAWIPWSNTRLGWRTGYGAGITSPGWYEHLWKYPSDYARRWVLKTAQVFRQKKMDISVAHVIETVRLAETLAHLRGKARVQKLELDEATLTVMAEGNETLLHYIEDQLTVGKKIGKLPADLPKLPILKDFEAKVKSARLQIREDPKVVQIDLRKPIGLRKSKFLFQLQILDVSWAKELKVSGKGTFKESWELTWKPEITLEVIDKAYWGNTVQTAAEAYLKSLIKESDQIQELTTWIQLAIKADLTNAIPLLIDRIDKLLSTNSDVTFLLGATLPLVEVSQYSSVRQTEATIVDQILEAMFIKIFIGLPVAVVHLEEEASNFLFNRIVEFDEALTKLQWPNFSKKWHETLRIIESDSQSAPIINGSCLRLLLNYQLVQQSHVHKRLQFNLSATIEPQNSALWLEGFLRGSGLILIYDQVLWNTIFDWVNKVPNDLFEGLLPLLRRTFANFKESERQELAKKVSEIDKPPKQHATTEDIDHEEGLKAVDTLISFLKQV